MKNNGRVANFCGAIGLTIMVWAATPVATRAQPLALSTTNRVIRPLTNRISVMNATRTTDGVISKAAIRVDSQFMNPESIRVLSYTNEGAKVHISTNTVRPAGGIVELNTLQFRQHILMPTNAARFEQLTAGTKSFPGVLVLNTSNEDVHSYQLFLEARPIPLRWDSTSNKYAAQLTVGLDMTNSDPPRNLPYPVTVQFFPSNAMIEPESVQILRTGPSGYEEVNISCSLDQKNPSVRLKSDMGDLFETISLEDVGFSRLMGDIFPLPFLFAALVGGCVGGSVRLLQDSRAFRIPELRRILLGALVGLIVAGAASVRLTLGDLAQTIVGQPASIFIIAAVAGYVGTPALDALAQKLGITSKPESK